MTRIRYKQVSYLPIAYAFPPPHVADMEITISKIVAVVIALGYAIAIIVNVGFTTHATSVLLLFVPISAAMFRFTIRDVLWLTVVMSDISS